MIRWFLDLLYGSVSVEWESAYPLAESVARLRAVTLRSVFSALAEPAAVGTVSESRVKLQRVIPMVGNSFKPFFLGQFVKRGERVFLTGRFTMLLITKVFMSLWLGLLACVSVTALVSMLAAPAGKPGRFLLVLGPLLMMAFGIGMLRLAKWFCRNDVGWLTHVIRRAISTTDSAAGAETLGGTSPLHGPGGRPTVLTIAAAVLGLMGMLNLFGCTFGWPPHREGSMGLWAEPLSSGALRYAIALQGIFLLATAVGVYRRALLAWKAVFLLIASACLWSSAGLFLLKEDMGPPLFIRIVFAVAAVFVIMYWCRWWNAQRVHFAAK
jgi:hypothetical protein